MKVKVIHIRELFFKKKSSVKENNINSESEVNSDSKLDNHSLLYHEWKNSSDSYSYKKKDPSKKFIRGSEKTLGSNRLFSWYSSTLDFSLGKKSPAKETSTNSESEMNSDSELSYDKSEMNFVSKLNQDKSETKSISGLNHKFNSILNFDSYIHNNKNLRIWGFSASALLILISLLNLCPVVLKGTEAEAATGTETAGTTTLTYESESESADLNLIVRDSSGTFSASSDENLLKFNITTNNYTGYTLTISGDAAGELSNGSSSLASVENRTDAYTFEHGSAATYSGKWGYLPSKYNSAANSNYLPAPGTSGNTLDVTSGANSTANSYTIGLGARAGYDTPSGTYTNTFTLSYIGNAVDYAISYADNTGDSSVANMPSASTSGSTSNTKIELPETVPARTGYTFAGWCSVAPTVNSNGSTSCSGTIYPASTASSKSYFGIDQTTTNITTLYASWTINTYALSITFAGSGVTSVKVCTESGDCSGSSLKGTVTTSGNSVSGLTYKETYYLYPVISENHELDSWENTGSFGTLSSVSDLNPSFIIAAGNGAVTVTGKQTYKSMQEYTLSLCSTEAASAPVTLVDSRDGQLYTVRYINGSCYMTSNLRFVGTSIDTSSTNVATATSSITWKSLKDDSECKGTSNTTDNTTYWCKNSGMDNLGNPTVWYNYAAASAGTITGTSNEIEDTYNICPKGWTLPSKVQFSGITSYVTEFSPVYGGFYVNGTLSSASTYAHWWSSTAGGITSRYSLRYHNGLLDTINVNRRDGFYIRCILSSIANAVNLQDVTKSMAENTAVGATASLKDSRDNQTYTVKKLDDGNLWMIDNLNLGATTLSTDLTSSNTNLSTTITASTFNGWKKSSGSQTYTAGEFIPVSGTDSTSGTAYGTLYNYYAASAGTISGDSNSNDAAYDICPKGWRLPTDGPFGEFRVLSNNSSYDSLVKMRASIANGGAAFALAGSFSNAAPKNQGSYGNYWSSSQSSTTGMYALYLGPSAVFPADNIIRRVGYSIRCIFKSTSIPSGTMQDASSPSLFADGATGTLTDSRDGQEYTVVKYGNLLWMTRNLAIGCNGTGSTYGSSMSSKQLTSSNSNVSTSWSTPTTSLDKSDNTTGCTTSDGSDCNSYTTARMKCDSTYGAWYNYAAATAGTITRISNRTEASSSICPSGWRLPANSELITETAFKNIFSPVYGSYYSSGTLNDASTRGLWWSSTASDTMFRYGLRYFDGSLSANYVDRQYGYYVRCIRAAS